MSKKVGENMAIKAGTIYSELVLNTKDFERGLRTAQSQSHSLEKKLSSTGKKMTAAVTVPLVGIGTAAVKTTMDFDAAMSEVAAISGATGGDFDKLREKAKQMGRDTKFSASESAEALTYMAMAGWKTEDMLDGLDGIMMLAAASGEDLALTSDIVTDALTAFGMEAKQAGEFADLLASASSNSNTNVAMMGESFKYVAPIFGSLGYSAEDAALALGLMANAGIKGSRSGTALRSAITRLVNPRSDEAVALIKDLGLKTTDASGKMLPFIDVMDQLRDSFAKLTPEQQSQYAATIFGQEAMAGMLSIINASESDYQKLTKATRDYNGEAKRMSDTMQKNLKGDLIKLKSQLEGVAIQVGEILVPQMSKMVEGLSDAVTWFSELDDSTRSTIIQIGKVAAATGPLLMIGSKVAGGINNITMLTGGLTSATGLATGAIGGLGGAASSASLLLNPFILAIGGVATGGVALAKHLQKDAIPSVDYFGESVSKSTQEALGGFFELQEGVESSLNEIYWTSSRLTEETANEITSNIKTMGEQVTTSIDENKENALHSLGSLFDESSKLNDEAQDELLKSVEEGFGKQTQAVQDNISRQIEIIEEGMKNGGELGEIQKTELKQLQDDLGQIAIETMTESETEQYAILNRLKYNTKILTAEQALEVAKNAREQKDAVIEEAEEEYKERIRYVTMLKDDLGIISEEEFQFYYTEEMYNTTLAHAQIASGEYLDHIDWENLEMKSRLDLMKEALATHFGLVDEEQKNHLETFQRQQNDIRLALDDSSKKFDEVYAETGSVHEALDASMEKFNELGEANEETRETVVNALNDIQDTSGGWRDKVVEDFHDTLEAQSEYKIEFDKTGTKAVRVYKDMAGESGRTEDATFKDFVEMSKSSEGFERAMKDAGKTTGQQFGKMSRASSVNMDTVTRKIDGGVSAIGDWNRAKPKTKTFSIVEKIKQIFSRDKGYAQGTNYYPGGSAWVGEEGPELSLSPSGELAWLGAGGMQLVDLPVGTKIYPYEKSMELAKMMNIPMFKDGGTKTATGRRPLQRNDIPTLPTAKEGDIIIENMHVRDDTDIYLISRELNNLKKNNDRYRGRK